MRPLYDEILPQHARVPQVFEDRNINLRVRLQIRVARKLEVIEQREGADGSGHRQSIGHQLPGVFSSCCFVQTRFGLSSSDFEKALRASAFRPALRCASPSQRYASSDFGLSSMAF